MTKMLMTTVCMDNEDNGYSSNREKNINSSIQKKKKWYLEICVIVCKM